MNNFISPLPFEWIPILKLYLLTHPTILAGVAPAYPLMALGPWAQSLEISGRVIDPVTERPIHNAKVVISAWNLVLPSYDSNPTKFLVRTDENGYFKVARRVDFVISKVHFEASAPDGRYASGGSGADLDLFQIYKPLRRKGVRRYFFIPGKGHFELRVYELPESDKRYSFLQYDTFRGGIGGEPEYVSQ